MPRLSVIKEGVEIESVDLDTLKHPNVILGRSEACDVHLEGRAVGREHAVISIETKGMRIQKKSKFGKLTINGAEVDESTLKLGDVISIADYQLRLEEAQKSQKMIPEEGPALEDIPPEPSKIQEPLSTQQTTPTQEATPVQQVVAIPGVSIPSLEIVSSPEVVAESGDHTVMTPQVAVVTQLVFKPGEANVEIYEIKKSEISIGRGTECDVILNDPKASRKHVVIKRVGLNFVAQDLGSGNGTFVNGEQITQRELAGEDKLKIGDTEFTFKALSQEYFEKQQEFIQVPSQEKTPSPVSEAAPEVILGGGVSADQIGMIAGQEMMGATPVNIPGLTPQKPKKETLIEKFKRQPLPRKIMIAIGIFVILYYVLSEEETPKNKPKPSPSTPQTADASFNVLPREKKQFVINTYQLAFDLYKNQEFEKALFEVNKILEILPGGYKDARDIKLYASKAIEIKKSQEEERRRKEEEAKVKAEVASLLEQAQELINKGKDTEARDVFTKVLERDPENATILRLKSEMEEKERQTRLEAERMADLAKRKKQLQDLIKEGQKLLKAEKFYEVMAKMADAPLIGLDDKKLLKQAKSLIEQAKQRLHDKIQPYLNQGKAELSEKNYTKARDAYFKALEVDSLNEEAKAGLEKIGEALHSRAKKIYIEAVIAEAISDYKTAKLKYKECFDQSMPDDIYYGRCSRKYKRFQMLNGGPQAENRSYPTEVEQLQQENTSDDLQLSDEAPTDPTEPVLPHTEGGE